jgi:hypothetical protein
MPAGMVQRKAVAVTALYISQMNLSFQKCLKTCFIICDYVLVSLYHSLVIYIYIYTIFYRVYVCHFLIEMYYIHNIDNFAK